MKIRVKQKIEIKIKKSEINKKINKTKINKEARITLACSWLSQLQPLVAPQLRHL
jgi:hypothetical protein